MFSYAVFASIWRPSYSFIAIIKNKDVYTLTDENFDELVGNGTNGTWFIHFYAPVKYSSSV